MREQLFSTEIIFNDDKIVSAELSQCTETMCNNYDKIAMFAEK